MVQSPRNILENATSDGKTLEDVAENGIQGVARAAFLYAIAFIAGLLAVLEAFFDNVSDGIGNIIGTFLNGIALIIGEGAESSAGNLLEIFNTGFIEALVIALAAFLLFRIILDRIDSDVGFPGLAVIPFVGESSEDDEE